MVSDWRSVIALSLKRGRRRPPYHGKTVHVHANKHDADRRTAPGARGHRSVTQSHSGNGITRIGLHTSEKLKGV